MLLALGMAAALPAQAVCPVCTVAVGAGLGVSRYLGIDDLITGLWVGGFGLSAGLWLGEIAGQKWPKLPGPKVVGLLIMTSVVGSILWLSQAPAHLASTVWGIDKMVLGVSLGAGLFAISIAIDRLLRLANQGRVVIYYQKVILPVFLLALASFVLYQIL